MCPVLGDKEGNVMLVFDGYRPWHGKRRLASHAFLCFLDLEAPFAFVSWVYDITITSTFQTKNLNKESLNTF